MNKWKKAISTGMSAALVASLFTFIAAGTVSGAVSVTSAGNIPQGGSSVGTATFRITEEAANSLPNSAGSIDIAILDSASANTLAFSGTPVVSAPGSLGASASIVGNVLTFSWSASDTANIEYIDVSGLSIDDVGGAALGAVKATLQNPQGAGVAVSDFQGGGTASGTISAGIGIGATSVIVNVTTPSCIFTSAGTLDFATSAESVALTTASAINTPAVGQQTLTIGATGSVHNAGEVVSEATACAPTGVLASPGTVVATLTFDKPTNATVFAGENNSPASNLVLHEPSAGFLAAGTTFTYTIATAGVVFSAAPTVSDTDGTSVLTAPVLAGDRKSVTVTVTTASGAAANTITLSNIKYDVAATVPGGTFISVGVTTSAGKAVSPSSRTNAVVFRGILAVSATTPTVYIGENNQAAGIISFTENAAGFFTDGTGNNNTFAVCSPLPFGSFYEFTVAPYAKVVGGTAAGNVILRDGAGPSTTNIVKGIQSGNCYYWTVWTKSTTASTIQIGNADLSGGALINVDVDQPAGPVSADLFIGNNISVASLAATVTFAVATFRNQVAVTALSQPTIPAGTPDALAGNIQVAETGIGQLKNNEQICFEVLPRTSNFTFQDTYLKNLNVADLPIATASGGVVISPVTMSVSGCTEQVRETVVSTHTVSFRFTVLQQSTNGTGKVVVSNIHYVTTADAPTGNVLVNAFGLGGAPTSVQFQTTVSNARIGSAQVDAWIAAGNNVRAASAFGLNTVIVKQGTRVTLRFKGASALAGDLVQIWVKTKTTAWKLETNRRITSDGYAYYSPKVLNKGYRYYRVVINGNVSNTIRAFGK